LVFADGAGKAFWPGLGLSFVSTQNAQGVGEFTLLPTTTYLALNKHIKPQNEVIA